MGLAAPQVGVNVRLMVFNEAGERGKGEEMVLANPKIVSAGRQTWTEQEACLSFNTDTAAVYGHVEVRRPACAFLFLPCHWGMRNACSACVAAGRCGAAAR